MSSDPMANKEALIGRMRTEAERFGVTADGQPTARRSVPPLHLRRTRFAPKLVQVTDYADYLKKVEAGWVDADKHLPLDMQRLLVECYGGVPACAAKGCQECRSDGGITAVLRRLCAEALAERDAKRRKPAAVATPAKKATATKRRAR